MLTTLSSTQLRQWADDGYVVVRNAIPPESVDRLIVAITRILGSALAGEFETELKWIDRDGRIPHFLSDLIGPEKYDPAFGEFLSEVTLPIMEQLIGADIRTSWMMLLTGGAGHPYSVALHRDNSAVDRPNEQELLDRYDNRQCYFQAALLPDSFLETVPGSHRRLATPQEIAATHSTTFCSADDVPGLITIDLNPGDVIFRSTNLLHQGKNINGASRWTLVSASWADALPIVPVEQDDYRLVSNEEFVAQLPLKLRQSVERYLLAHREKRFEAVVSD